MPSSAMPTAAAAIGSPRSVSTLPRNVAWECASAAKPNSASTGSNTRRMARGRSKVVIVACVPLSWVNDVAPATCRNERNLVVMLEPMDNSPIGGKRVARGELHNETEPAAPSPVTRRGDNTVTCNTAGSMPRTGALQVPVQQRVMFAKDSGCDERTRDPVHGCVKRTLATHNRAGMGSRVDQPSNTTPLGSRRPSTSRQRPAGPSVSAEP